MLVELGFPEYIKVTDLGCSSGPNTFLAMSGIVNTIIDLYHQKGRTDLPEIDYFLNDLPENDFNTTFKLLPSFQKGLKTILKGRCFMSGTPGSFYSRLFPKKSLHFVHLSYSIHWLSKVPQGLKEDDNKKSVFLNSSSTQKVYKSYLDQFQTDFSLFLKMRSEEIMPNGRMVLVFMGRQASDPMYRDCFHPHVGLVKESEVDAFNMPFYDPTKGEVKDVIESEGSFEINKIETREFAVHYASGEDVVDESSDQFKQWQNIANIIIKKYAIHVAKHLTVSVRPTKTTVNIVVSKGPHWL
ncbi:unnamed protein product [Arabis nemorensis]|uniref:Uncharacterized protein n=1 Tax=Arabis nemorensis TaxID=586526 RepID=A0A565AQF1_9BRAS|nr:unnamed protein product [Arabis nemorensis]